MKIKETIKNNSIWQHISFVVIALLFFNTAVCYCGVFFEGYLISLMSGSFIEDILFSVCYHYRFMITDMFLMDLDPSVAMQQRNIVIQIAVFFVSLAIIFVALGLYKSWGKYVAICFIVLVSINIIVSFILIFVPYLLISVALQVFLIIALSMTIRHLNKKAKKKPLYC